MNTKTLFTICLLLLGLLTVQAQELVPFQESFESDIPIFGKWGYKDSKGKIVIKPAYANADYFSEGLASVATLYDGLYSYKGWGFIDTKGRMVIPAKYDRAKSFSEGLAAVNIGFATMEYPSKKGNWGFIDKTGKEIIALKYEDAKSFINGMAAIKLNGKWGFIDKTGNETILPKYDNAHSFSEGLAAVELNKNWGFIDQLGKEVIPFVFDRIGEGGLFPDETTTKFKNGKILVKKDNREYYIDKTGKEIVDENTLVKNLTTAYQSGNFPEAFKLAEQLANNHNADAMNLLGNMHAQGQGTKQNYYMARSWWEMASAKGNAAATGNIGLLYAQGWGVPQNMVEAENWFKKGADMGDAQSMFNLGYIYAQQGKRTEAVIFFQKAKNAGHPQAQAALQQLNATSPVTNEKSKEDRIKEKN